MNHFFFKISKRYLKINQKLHNNHYEKLIFFKNPQNSGKLLSSITITCSSLTNTKCIRK